MSACPRCSGELEETELEKVPVSLCASCDGIFVAHRRLIPLMEAMTQELAAAIDPDTPLEAADDLGQRLICPSCAGSMEAFGYMGTRLVILDRCPPCHALWIDGRELAAMCVLYARTERRSHDRRAAQRSDMEDLSRRIHSMLINRALSDWLA